MYASRADVDSSRPPQPRRGSARGDESRRRRGRDADIPETGARAHCRGGLRYVVTKPAEGGDDDAPATDDDAKPATTCYWRSSTNEFDDDATDYYACGLSEPFASVSIVSADDGVVHEVGSSFQGPCAAITPLNNCLVAVGCSQDASMLPEWTPGLCGGASVHAIDLATA